jgi:hypothetical protein
MTTALALVSLVAPSMHNSEVSMTASRTPKAFRPASVLKSFLTFFFSPKHLQKLFKRKSGLELDSIHFQGNPSVVHVYHYSRFSGGAELYR